MSLLESIREPADLRRLSRAELDGLAARDPRLPRRGVSRTGGHLGPNLGVVELTLALHRVFDSPRDRIVCDTGHQAYVHKILTGRAGRVRPAAPGAAGCPATRAGPRSEHDWSRTRTPPPRCPTPTGWPRRSQLRGERPRGVVAVVGDGALTGGMCWEALNNIAAAKDRPVVIVVNDNGRSYAPTIGGLADHLATLRLSPGYEQVLGRGASRRSSAPRWSAAPIYDALHGVEEGPQGLRRPAGHVRGPRPEVRRPGRRARRRARSSRRCAAAKRLRRPGDRALRDRARAAATRRPRTTKPTDAPAARMRPATGAPVAKPAAVLDHRLRRGDGARSRRQRAGRRRDHRGDAGPGRAGAVRRDVPGPGLRRRHRRAARGHLGGRAGHGRAAPGGRGLRDVPEPGLRPGADGRGPAPAAGHLRARPGRRHRRRRRQPPRHVGPVDPGMVPGLRVAAPRDAGTLREELREAVAVDDGPTASASPRAPVGRRRAGVQPGRRRGHAGQAGPGRRTC